MNFKYYELSTVYRLAWCAVKKYNCKIVKVYHGSGVETFENFFVEGAWDGEFNLGNFDESAFFMGTGANCKNQGKANVTFSTSSHTLERLYSISFNEDIYISNSLPLILYLSDSKLDSKYLN